MIHRCHTVSAFLGALLVLPIGTPVSAQEASPIDIEMDRNPVLAYAKIEHVFPRGAAGCGSRLWIDRMSRRRSPRHSRSPWRVARD